MNTQPLYERILGRDFDALPGTVRAMHDVRGRLVAEGRCRVQGPTSFLLSIVSSVFGLPSTSGDVAVRIEMVEVANGEKWTRWMGRDRFCSLLAQARGRHAHCLTEQFGLFKFFFDVPVDASGLCMVLARMTCAGVPVPRVFWPRVRARERCVDDRFRFDVSIEVPRLGRLVAYSGWFCVVDG